MTLSTADYEEVLAHATSVFALVDGDGVVRYQSPAVRRVLGREPSALVGESVLDLVHPADREAARAALASPVAPDETGARTTLRLGHADGSWVPLSVRVTHRSAAGCVVAGRPVEGPDPDVVARDERAALDRMTDGFFALGPDWTVEYANDAGRRVLGSAMGRDPEETTFVGLDLWAEAPESVGTTFYERYHEAMATQEPVSFEAHYPPLSAWFHVRAFPSERGLSVYFRDVTEERRRRETLERRERVLRETYEVVAARDRSFTEKIEAMLGLVREELGVDYGTLSRIEGDDYVFEVVDAVDDAVAAGDVVPLAATNCEVAASTRRTLVLGDVARDAPAETDRAGYAEWGIACYLGAPTFVEGEVYGTFCFYDTEPRSEFDDWAVTLVDLLAEWASYELERRHAADRLARKNERLERFASVVSHDLRNPLGVLDGSLDLARETGDPAHFDRCERAVERMETLVDELLTLARADGESVTPEPVALDEVVRGCWDQVETGDATLDQTAVRSVVADESRLRRLFENLFRNALDHTGSAVTVRVGDLPDGFFVADDGPGIPAAERDRVFDHGYSTRTGGTGFGLSVVAEAVEAHGWTVRAGESEAGGARFEVTGVDRPD
jgi:PAS domain S-box-containing protein